MSKDLKTKPEPKPTEVNIRITRDPKGGLDVQITTDEEDRKKSESKSLGKRRLCD